MMDKANALWVCDEALHLDLGAQEEQAVLGQSERQHERVVERRAALRDRVVVIIVQT